MKIRLKTVIATLLSTLMLFQCVPTMGVTLGDVDENGVISSNDAAMVLQYVLNSDIMPLEGNQLQAAKVIDGNTITSADAAQILQKSLNSDFVFSVSKLEETTEVTTKTSETTQTTTEATTTQTTTKKETTTQTTTTTTTQTTTKKDTTTETTTKDDTSSQNKTVWNVSDFATGTYTGSNGLTAVGSSSKDAEVAESSVSIDGFNFTKTLKTRGKGSTSKSYVMFEAPTSGILVVYAKNGSQSAADNEIVVYQNGNTLTSVATGSYDAEKPVKVEVNVPDSGEVYIYGSAGALNIYYISFTGGAAVTQTTTKEPTTQTTTKTTTTQTTTKTTTQTTTKKTTTEATTQTTTKTTTTQITTEKTETTTSIKDDGNYVIATDYTSIKDGISKMESSGGGTVYIQGDFISCSGVFSLSKSNANVALVGITNSDGTAPILDFEASGQIGKGESGSAIYVKGSGYTFKNFIVQHSLDCGMRIKGSSAGNCLIDHMVFRYNSNSGISITSGASNNTIQYTDAYRNCDIQKSGADAEGFACKLSAGNGNKYFNCRSWENADDGWDSYDHTGDLTYEQCATWSNGVPEIFTGEYDFEKGNPLDKNLLFVKQLLKDDSSFETKYNNALKNGTSISFPQSTGISTAKGTITVSSLKSNWGGNPNGFKFGSANVGSSAKRTVIDCLAFDCEAKGFDQNNAAATISFKNTVAFGCGKNNYQTKNMNVTSCTNAVGFDGSNSIPSSMKVITPSTSRQTEIKNEVNNKVNGILDKVYNDKIPGNVTFNIF